nr:hypothetical protein [Tanacetum cinerariifolium]
MLEICGILLFLVEGCSGGGNGLLSSGFYWEKARKEAVEIEREN